MAWSDVGRKVIEIGAPLLGAVLGGPAGAGIGKLVATAVTGDPDASASAVEQAIGVNPEVAVRLREIEAEQRTELQRLLVTAEHNRLVHEQALVAQSAETQRAEIASGDDYVRRARPTLVYVACAAVAAVVLSLCGSILAATVMLYGVTGLSAEQIAAVGSGVTVLLAGGTQLTGALMPIIVTILGAAGYYIKRRSDEKSIDATGERAPSLLDALTARLGGGR